MDHEFYPYYFYEPGKEPFRNKPDVISQLAEGARNALRRTLGMAPKVDGKLAPKA